MKPKTHGSRNHGRPGDVDAPLSPVDAGAAKAETGKITGGFVTVNGGEHRPELV